MGARRRPKGSSRDIRLDDRNKSFQAPGLTDLIGLIKGEPIRRVDYTSVPDSWRVVTLPAS